VFGPASISFLKRPETQRARYGSNENP